MIWPTTIYTRTWLREGNDYQAAYAPNGDTALDRWVGAYIEGKRTYKYQRLPSTVHGLTAYTPIGIDDTMRRRPQGTSYFDQDIYFHHDKNGKVDAFRVKFTNNNGRKIGVPHVSNC